MILTDLTTDWKFTLRGLKDRFPHLDEKEIARCPPATQAIAEHLAQRHDLTPLEAEEELKDWLFVQSLARQAVDVDMH